MSLTFAEWPPQDNIATPNPRTKNPHQKSQQAQQAPQFKRRTTRRVRPQQQNEDPDKKEYKDYSAPSSELTNNIYETPLDGSLGDFPPKPSSVSNERRETTKTQDVTITEEDEEVDVNTYKLLGNGSDENDHAEFEYQQYLKSYKNWGLPGNPFNQNKPNNNTNNAPVNTNANEDLLKKLNYMIHLLEEQKDEKTNNVTEEVILYVFLGIFIIFIVDSFSKSGKYVR